ncbi:MAG: Lrp/AsnC family transcriptional regulator [Pseudonocardia sp.]|nr:Lrp/AsnC family transcriptional regulator [Pseudonocardia sp.]MBO0873979.1 Lrp/AsnC family transcriptional regulator [Pseudonocardia sp.]
MDAVDRRIVDCLLRDGRATYGDIGAQVGLSAPAAKRRVDRLRASGAIRGFTVVLDPSALGWTTEAYVEVYCRGNVSPRQLRETLEQVPEVLGACTVSGAADALLHMVARDIKHLEQAMERVRDQPDIDHTESVIVLSRLIDRPRS